jgi:hypothetical protein
MRRLTVAAAVLAMVAGVAVTSVPAEASFKFSGDVLYRWQFDYHKYTTVAAGKDSLTTGDFSNKYWWNLRMAIEANENLSFNIRLSNPKGYQTDLVNNLFRAGNYTIYNVVSIPEFYFKWKYSIVGLSGGIIPVGAPPTTNSVLDLVAAETKEVAVYDTVKKVWKDTVASAGYVNAGIMPWYVATNASQMGLDLNLGIYKSDAFCIGFDLLGTVASDRPAVLNDASNAIKVDQYRFLVQVPMAVGGNKLTVTPTVHVRTNIFRSADLKNGDYSLVGGIDVAVKPLPNLSGKVGFAGGGYDNSCLKGSAGYVPTAPTGLLFNAGIEALPEAKGKYGKANVDFAWGGWMDTWAPANKDGTYNVFYWDIKYGYPVKSLTFQPRLRMWYYTNSDNKSTQFFGRPELDFIAKF